MAWDRTVRQIVHDSHREGCWDLLRALLDHAEPEHECQALEWAYRLYRDPQSFNEFVRDAQIAREGKK